MRRFNKEKNDCGGGFVADQRKIIHVDMDAFYASIEMRDHPELQNVPLVVSRNPRHSGGHGVVATANYIARQYGIHSAMSAQEALRRCPQAHFKRPDFPKYHRVSDQIHALFHEYTDMIEPVALDEAYLDVTHNKKGIRSAIVVARQIQRAIFEQTHLTCSVGVAPNKFLAKLGSEYRKPVGVTVVRQEDVRAFLDPLPIETIRGVGKKTVVKMHAMGIETGADLYATSDAELIRHFGKAGHLFYERIRGIDPRPVEWQRERKSIGSERTFDQPLMSSVEVERVMHATAERLVGELHRKQKHGKTLVIKVRNAAFETVTRRITLDDYFENDVQEIQRYGQQLFDMVQPDAINVRLLGLTMTNLDDVAFENIRLPL